MSRARRRAFAIANRKSQIANAFTLTEILIVIGLIVLVLALAIPAFNFITGSRSVDAGENLVSAMLGRARALAINTNQPVGVAFFREPVQDRSAMAIVASAALRSTLGNEASGLEQYKAWRVKEEDGITNVVYKPGDVVIALVDMPVPNNGKKGTKIFICEEEHTAANGNKPPQTPYWGSPNESSFDTLVGFEFQYLPPGVGAQTINDPDPESGGAPRDRYLRSGLVLFGGDGSLLHRKYVVAWPGLNNLDDTKLFNVMGFNGRPPPLDKEDVGIDPAFPIYSQIGVVLYEEELWRGAGGSPGDPLNDDQAMTPGETGEEQWIDQNCLSLLINRYNGTLIRGE